MNEQKAQELASWAQRSAIGHIADELAHDDIDRVPRTLNLDALESFEWWCALRIVREERDRMAALLTPAQVAAVMRDVREWSAK